MNTNRKAARIAVAAAVCAAVALPASGAMAASKTTNALLGAVLGGVAGAALSNGDGGAVAIGAVAGAALGAATTKDKRHYRSSYRQPRQPYYQNSRYDGYDRGQRYDYRRTDYRYGDSGYYR